MKTSSGYSLFEMMVGISLMGSVSVMTVEILERINKGVSSQEILNQSRNEAMVFFQRVHHASMTVLPDACADDMTARGVVGQPDDSAAQMNLSVNLGGDADPEFILMNSCVEKPVGMRKPPVMNAQYLQSVVRKDARRRMSNRMNYSESQCLSQMQVSCPENYMPVTRLVYYGRDGSPKQMYFPRASRNRRSDGTVTSFACTFKEPGVGGPINVVLFAGHKDPAMQNATEEIVKWTSFRTVLPPRPTNAAYVRSPDVCSAMSPLPLDITPGTAVVSNGGGASGDTGFDLDSGSEDLVQVEDVPKPSEAVADVPKNANQEIADKEQEDDKIRESFEGLSSRNKRMVKNYLQIAQFFFAKAGRTRGPAMKQKHLRSTNFYLSKIEVLLGITPERNMSYDDRLEKVREHISV